MKQLSKFISMLLRHHPEALQLQMDEHGYVDVKQLVDGINQNRPFTMEDLQKM